MNNNIVVSVICNTYNHENYICKALDSFLMQKTDFKFEVLVHDDASTDKTQSIIREYEKKYPDIIKPIYQTENQYSQRIGINKNFQYPRAKGKYVAFCEGDDFWTDPEKLQKQVNLLEDHPQYIGCVHKYTVVDEFGNISNQKTFGYYEEEGIYTFNDFFQKELPSQLATLMVKNVFLDKEKHYPNEFLKVRVQGDVKLFLYLLTYGDIYRMSDEMSAYRFVFKSGGSSWSSRLFSKPHGFETFKGLKLLEKTYKEVYKQKINLKKRKDSAVINTWSDLKRFKSLITLYHAFIILFLYPRSFAVLCKCLMQKYILK